MQIKSEPSTSGININLSHDKNLDDVNLKENLFDMLRAMKLNADELSIFIPKLMDGLFVFGINEKTPISKEMSEIIYGRLSAQFVQLIENMTDIYAKLKNASYVNGGSK